MIRPILRHPNKLLRKRSRDVTGWTSEVSDIVHDMVDTLLAANGSGLAAIQIGQPLRIIVLSCVGERIVTLVNPRIVKVSGHVRSNEGCLSLPGRWVKLDRYASVHVEHLRPHGLEILKADEAELAVAVQHEIDHLNGVLTVDRMHSKLSFAAPN